MQNQHKDGISLKPIIEENKIPKKRPLFWHYPHYGNQGGDPSSMIREGDWKLIHYYENSSNELYNLKEDESEQHNIATKFPEITTKLYQKLQNWLVSVDAKYPQKDNQFTIEKRKKYDARIANKLLPKLEKERVEMLTKDFQPNQDWWGSKQTKD